MPSASNPMQQAVFRGCVECIRMLVETPPYYSVDSCCGPDGLRPIHIAAREGHIQTLRFLSSAGACLQRSDFNGFTALHHGAITGQLRAVRWLLRHGGKILLDKRGRSPIQVAADHDHMEIVNVLAKHATTVSNGTSLNNKDSRQSPVKSPTNNIHNSSSDNTNGEANRTSIRSDNDDTQARSGLTTENLDEDYSLSQSDHNNNHNSNPECQNNNNKNQNPKPFSHLHLSSEEADGSFKASSTSPGDCASSSGNSSLTASTSAPSLSPSGASSSSVASCSCSTSDETTLLKSIVEVSDSFTLEEYEADKTPTAAEQRNSLVSSPAPFFLHPPKDKGSCSPPNTQLIDFDSHDNIGSVNGTPLKKKSNHKRQDSIASSSPFFLHPPENLVTETQSVVSKMAPTPVNPSHAHHHFADPINEPTPKMKVPLPGDSSSSSSSSSSPPLTPTQFQKSGGLSGSTVSSCLNKFQQQDNSQNKKREVLGNNKCPSSPTNSETEIKIKNQLNSSNESSSSNSVPPPPPPPPPLPFSDSNNNLIIPSGHGLHFHNKQPDFRNASPSKQDILETENDYEDIEELTNGTNHYEQARKLLRSVSAPPPMNENGFTGQNKSDDTPVPPALPERILVPNRPPLGCGKPGVPFIPPHFPTPLHDALIKPSEYLRSIQNKSKGSSGNNGANAANNGAGSISRPSSRVEEALKALGVHDNHNGLMSPVPEETNAEDEFEEINAERIKVTGQENGSYETHPNQSNSTGSNSTSGPEEQTNRGYGMIKAEELMKVHLRKTPMSRTKSAPPLGRVIPDDQVQSPNFNPENGHEPLKRTHTTAANGNGYGSTGTEAGTVSKAAVIAELAESSQVGGVREWKEELKRRQKEQDKHVQKEIEQLYQPVNFVAEVPATDVTGAPIPDWKRQMMAKKAAERARREAEEQRRLEIEAKRMASIPIWRRQLLQRRESDGKYAQ